MLKSPFELATGRKTSTDHLRKFGCLVMAHVFPHEALKALDNRARPGVFLGFAPLSSTPLIGTWVKEKNKSKLVWRVQENGSVKFCESTCVHDVMMLQPDADQ